MTDVAPEIDELEVDAPVALQSDGETDVQSDAIDGTGEVPPPPPEFRAMTLSDLPFSEDGSGPPPAPEGYGLLDDPADSPEFYGPPLARVLVESGRVSAEDMALALEAHREHRGVSRPLSL